MKFIKNRRHILCKLCHKDKKILFSLLCLLILFGATIGRSFFFLIYPESNFDADQAVYGIMALDIAQGRSFPLTFYGQKYLMAIHSWMAAPLFSLFTPSITTLKTPLFILNLLVVLFLFKLSLSQPKINKTAALAICMILAAAPVALSARLMAAEGASIGVFLHILCIWQLRKSPLFMGLYLGVFYLHREFILYGFLALIVLDVINGLSGCGQTIKNAFKNHLTTLFTAILTYNVIVGMGYHFKLFWGPGRPPMPMMAPSSLWDHLAWGFSHNIIDLMGFKSSPNSLFGIVSHGYTTPEILAISCLLLFGVYAVKVSFLGVKWWRQHKKKVEQIGFWIYLLLVGLGSMSAYSLFVSINNASVSRYCLLNILFPIGLVGIGFYLQESLKGVGIRKGMRLFSIFFCCLLVASSGIGHLKLYEEYRYTQPKSVHHKILKELKEAKIEYALANYWEAYHLSFLSGERVVVASRDHVRVERYQKKLARHAEHNGAFALIQKEKCRMPSDLIKRVDDFFICRGALKDLENLPRLSS